MGIPIGEIVSITPDIIKAPQTGLQLNGLFLTENEYIPINTILEFINISEVKDYFGENSDEYKAASIYFAGYISKQKTPDRVYFYRFVTDVTGTSPFLRSGRIGLTIDELKLVKGTLDITLNGVVGTLNLDFSAITSYSGAAIEIQTALRASVSANPSFNLATVTYDSRFDAFTILGGVKGATEKISFAIGSISQRLLFTEATGAVISQGADRTVTSDEMDYIVSLNNNFVSFTTIFEPTNEEVLKLADWSKSKGTRYLYVLHSIDPSLLIANNTTNIGSLLKQANAENVTAIYGDYSYAAFIIGAIASVNFNKKIITIAFKESAFIVPNVKSLKDYRALSEKGFNVYGDFSENNTTFKFLYSGSIYGSYLWIDTYINRIWLNSQIQTAMLTALTNDSRFPYNEIGYTTLSSILINVLENAVNIGVIDSQVQISDSQKDVLINIFNADISSSLFSSGYFLKISDPGSQARASRLTPDITLAYTYGGSIQQLNIKSTLVE